jgi:chemotaxis protein MotB
VKSLRRGRKFEHVDTEGTWAVSYADMITLLLSFFVLYFTVDHKRNQALQLQESLMVRLEQSGVKPLKFKGAVADLNMGPDQGDHIDRRILKKVGAQIYEFGDMLVIEFDGISFFNLGVVDVNSKGHEVLSAFAETYLPFAGQYDLVIRAFTDSRPVSSKTGRFKDNLELSALRSISAMRVLQGKGIPLKSMRIAGLGEYILPYQEQKLPDVRMPSSQDALRFARKVVLIIEPRRATGA